MPDRAEGGQCRDQSFLSLSHPPAPNHTPAHGMLPLRFVSRLKRSGAFAPENQFQKFHQPLFQMPVPDESPAQMIAPLLGTGHDETMRTAHHPALHHGAGQFGMKLHPPGIFTIAESLIG